MAGRRRSDRALRSKLHSPGRPSVAQREHRRRVLGIDCGWPVERGTRPSARVCPRRWEHGGSERQAACHHRPLRHHRSCCPGDTCRSPSGRSLRSSMPRAPGCGRSPGTWGGRDRRSRVSCAATLPRAVASWIIGPPRLSGMPNGRLGGRSQRSWRSTWRCGRMCRIGWPAWLWHQTGAAVPGPTVSWKGRRHGPRKDRRWALAWSPEQIAHRLRLDFPHDETMRISHEAIYQSLYVQGRGALRRELTACLRTGRALRVPRARSRGRGKSFIEPEIMISERPAEVADRAVRATGRRPHPGTGQFGDWHVGGADDAVHDAAAPAADGGARIGRSHEERPCVGRAWRRSRSRQHRWHHHRSAGAAAPIADMGSGSGDGAARPADGRHGPGHLFL